MGVESRCVASPIIAPTIGSTTNASIRFLLFHSESRLASQQKCPRWLCPIPSSQRWQRSSYARHSYSVVKRLGRDLMKRATDMPDRSKSAAHIALLAPIPREHIDCAPMKFNKISRVAFGSRDCDVFLKLDREREGMPVDVYIYESYGSVQYNSRVSWHGRYLQSVPAVNGTHPDRTVYRPDLTGKRLDDRGGGNWLIFWELDSLEEIAERDCLQVSAFIPFGRTEPYRNSFVPRGASDSTSGDGPSHPEAS